MTTLVGSERNRQIANFQVEYPRTTVAVHHVQPWTRAWECHQLHLPLTALLQWWFGLVWQRMTWNRIRSVMLTRCNLLLACSQLYTSQRKRVVNFDEDSENGDTKEEWLVTQCSALIGLLTLPLTGGGLDQDDRLIPVYCINPGVETAKSSFRVVAAKISQNLPSQY